MSVRHEFDSDEAFEKANEVYELERQIMAGRKIQR